MPIKKPLLVTGAHRSGSTWVGRMIALSPDLVYIHEPFNVNSNAHISPPGIYNVTFDYWFTYITSVNEGRFYKSLKKTIELRYNLPAALRESRHPRDWVGEMRQYIRFARYRFRGMQPLLKDPIAVLSAEWLADRFDMHVVVLIRHPAAFASSVKKKGWTHPFTHFLDQPLLMEEHLGPFEAEIAEYAERPPDIIDQACLLWRIIYYMVSKYKARHSNWIFLRHEDISREPLRYFEMLFAELGLEFTPEIERIITEHSNAANPVEPGRSDNELKRDSRANIWNWKQRLSPMEIAYIRQKVEDVSAEFYAVEDW